MLKITGEDGKTLYKIEDDATEPEVVGEFPSLCSAHQKRKADCKMCNPTVTKEGDK